MKGAALLCMTPGKAAKSSKAAMHQTFGLSPSVITIVVINDM